MAKYLVRVQEVLSRTVVVDAADKVDAIQKASDSDICLTYDDYADRIIEINEDTFKDGVVPDGEDVSFYWHLED